MSDRRKKSDGRVTRVVVGEYAPTAADVCRRCGGCHLPVINKVVVLDWFAREGKAGRFTHEPDFPAALASLRYELAKARASTDPPEDFQSHERWPHIRRENWRRWSGHFPKVAEALDWLFEMLGRIERGTPPCSEAEFGELAAWFAAHEAGLRAAAGSIPGRRAAARRFARCVSTHARNPASPSASRSRAAAAPASGWASRSATRRSRACRNSWSGVTAPHSNGGSADGGSARTSHRPSRSASESGQLAQWPARGRRSRLRPTPAV